MKVHLGQLLQIDLGILWQRIVPGGLRRDKGGNIKEILNSKHIVEAFIGMAGLNHLKSSAVFSISRSLREKTS